MTDQEPIQGPTRLSVVRRLDNGSELAELWVLHGWHFGYGVEEYSPLKLTCYVGDFNYLANLDRVGPHEDAVVKDSVDIQDAPEPIQQEFEGIADRLADALDTQHDDD